MRGNYFSPIFYELCLIEFAKKIIIQDNIKKIIVNSYPIKKILEKIIEKDSLDLKIIYSSTIKARIKNCISPILFLFSKLNLLFQVA